MKEPPRSQLQLETAALGGLPFSSLDALRASFSFAVLSFALERERLSHSTKHFTPVLFGTADF